MEHCRRYPGGGSQTRHKSGPERFLLAARGKIGEALESRLIYGSVRKSLDAASELIRRAELMIGKERLKVTTLDLGEAEAAVQSPQYRVLLSTFTQADRCVAEGNFALESKSPKKETRKCAQLLEGHGTVQDVDSPVRNALGMTKVIEHLKRAGELNFDALAFAHLPEVARKPLSVLGGHLLGNTVIFQELDEEGKVAEAAGFQRRVLRFLGKVDTLYNWENPYHGPAHAADVMMTMEWYFQTAHFQERTSTLDYIMGLMAGAIHDVGHPGRNQLFQTKTMSPLAVRYNDKSVLENMHVALSFETMQRDSSCDWVKMLSKGFRSECADMLEPAANLQQYVRRGLIDMVLATDMAKHADHVRKLNSFLAEEQALKLNAVEASGLQTKQEALERKLFLLETCLHASDLSNPCRPRPVMISWTQRVLDEFWSQGDEELRLGLEVSPLCDRASGRAAVPESQIGFVDFVVSPLYAPLAEMIEEVGEFSAQLAENRAFWADLADKKVTYEEIFGQ